MLGIFLLNQTDDVNLLYTIRQDPRPVIDSGNDSGSEDSDDSGIKGGMIAAIVVPIIGGGLIIVIIVWAVLKIKIRVKLQNMSSHSKEISET